MSFEPYDSIYEIEYGANQTKPYKMGAKKKHSKLGATRKNSRCATCLGFQLSWGLSGVTTIGSIFFCPLRLHFSFSLFSFSLAEILFFFIWTGIPPVKRVERLTSCWSIQNRFLAAMYLSSSKKGKGRNRVAAVDSFLPSAKGGALYWK